MEIKFYAPATFGIGTGVAYTSRGRLCDMIRREYRPRYVKEEIEGIQAHTLVLTDDESVDDNIDSDFSVRLICGHRTFDGNSTKVDSKWYLTKEAAIAAYGDGANEIITADLYLGHLCGPRTSEYPYSAYLMRNEKGLYCRLTINPDWEGNSTDGKMCFPDKSWNVACEGHYRVKVVRDMGNYAFIKGENDDYSFDELNLVLDHLWAKQTSLDTFIQKVSGSMFGTFYTMASDSCWDATESERDNCARAKWLRRDDNAYRHEMEARIDELNTELDNRGTANPTLTELGIIFQKATFGTEDNMPAVYEMLNEASDEQTQEMFEHVEWKKSIGDLFIEGAYGDIHSKEELYALFTKSGYLCERVGGKTIGPRNGKKVKGYWFLDDVNNDDPDVVLDALDPDVVLDAFDAGILTAYSLDGIRAIGVSENTVKELLQFSHDELNAIAEYVRKVNERADAAIEEKLKRGKLSLER